MSPLVKFALWRIFQFFEALGAYVRTRLYTFMAGSIVQEDDFTIRNRRMNLVK